MDSEILSKKDFVLEFPYNIYKYTIFKIAVLKNLRFYGILRKQKLKGIFIK